MVAKIFVVAKINRIGGYNVVATGDAPIDESILDCLNESMAHTSKSVPLALKKYNMNNGGLLTVFSAHDVDAKDEFGRRGIKTALAFLGPANLQIDSEEVRRIFRDLETTRRQCLNNKVPEDIFDISIKYHLLRSIERCCVVGEEQEFPPVQGDLSNGSISSPIGKRAVRQERGSSFEWQTVLNFVYGAAILLLFLGMLRLQ